MEFGSAVHFALEKLFLNMLDNNHVFPPLDSFIKDFDWFMYKHRESFTKEAYARRKEYGHTVLTDLYKNYIDRWSTDVAIEKRYKNVLLDGVPIKGAIDKMEFDGNDVVVVDYKTGDYAKAKDKLKPPTAKEPQGGTYWRQGLFYKLLIDNYKLNDYRVIKTSFQFVEPDDKQYVIHDIIPTAEDLNTVREQIKDTWHKIQNHDFYTGCGKEKCHWCNFVKNNHQYIDLKEAIIEDALDETFDETND